ncbi:MAG: sodium/glutamate symporter [Pyrinomonadaceae bacterium]
MLVAMGLGALVTSGLTRIGITLPGYIGAMVVAALGRNLDDKYNKLRIDMKAVQLIGSTALAGSFS